MKLYKLFPGTESEQKIRLLIQAANIQSDNKIAALNDHLCNGTPQKFCERFYEISQQTISSAVQQLNKYYALSYEIVHCK